MLRKRMDIQEATYEWVNGFDRIPQKMLNKLMKYDPDDITEVTAPMCGDRVYLYDIPEYDIDGNEYKAYHQEGKIVSIEYNNYVIELDDGVMVVAVDCELEIIRGDFLPIWETMFQFRHSADILWLEEEDGIEMMSKCGFRVYESEDFGYFFGIDGAGYDFYEKHWIPLYKARGLQMHD